MLNINGLSVIIYLIVAVAVIAFGTKVSRPGSTRIFVFAALFSVFFSMGIVVDHGIGTFPGFWLIGYCWYTDTCSKMFGSTGGLLFYTLLPMFVQWAIILMIFFGLFHLAKRTGFDQPVPIVMSEKAKKHRRIIGIVWIILAGLWFFILINSIMKIPATQLAELKVPITQWDPWKLLILMQRAIFPLLCLGVGYSLIKNLSWSRWLCFPFSVLALLTFPIGTAIGGYYLWYYLTIEKQT
ncbi:MAG: hypothetical protein L3K25_10185 [Gammaproteobacteria bacterium]|nr:hypothetical protein [Gammaproteobacteria bacterium]